jgi:hypothetical protein
MSFLLSSSAVSLKGKPNRAKPPSTIPFFHILSTTTATSSIAQGNVPQKPLIQLIWEFIKDLPDFLPNFWVWRRKDKSHPTTSLRELRKCAETRNKADTCQGLHIKPQLP